MKTNPTTWFSWVVCGALMLTIGCGSSDEGEGVAAATSAEAPAVPAAPATVIERVEQLAPATDPANAEVYERLLDQNSLA